MNKHTIFQYPSDGGNVRAGHEYFSSDNLTECLEKMAQIALGDERALHFPYVYELLTDNHIIWTVGKYQHTMEERINLLKTQTDYILLKNELYVIYNKLGTLLNIPQP